MIAWVLAANCHLYEPNRLPSQLSTSSTDILHVWNRRVPKEYASRSIESRFSVQPDAARKIEKNWARVNAAMSELPMRDTKSRRLRRFFPDYLSESNLSWKDMADLGTDLAGGDK